MRRTEPLPLSTLRLAVLSALLLAPIPGCGGDAAPASAKARVAAAIPQEELPRTGTISDAPSDAIEIGIAADGTILARGEEGGLPELEAALAELSSGPGTRAPDSLSERDVVIRASASVPWPVAQWVMQACAKAKLHRLHFAVMPETDGSEGVIGAWLPTAVRPSPSPGAEPPEPLDVFALAHDGTTDRGAVHAWLTSLVGGHPRVQMTIHTPFLRAPRISHVIGLLDLGLRAGIQRVTFRGAPGPARGTMPDSNATPGSLPWLRAWVAAEREERPWGWKIRAGGRTIDGTTERKPLPPPPPRRASPTTVELDDFIPLEEDGISHPPTLKDSDFDRPPEEEALSEEAIPREDLPRTGIVFDAPENALVIGIAADGSIHVDGTPGGLRELATALKEHAKDPSRRDPQDRGIRTNVILRASAAVPWPVVVWVMQTCAAHRFERLSFAVRPEGWGDEGVIDAYLPRDLGIISGGAPWDEKPQVKLALFAADAPTDAAALFTALKTAIAVRGRARVRIETPYPKVPLTGHVLSILDLARRAGAADVTFLRVESLWKILSDRDPSTAVDANEAQSLASIRAWVRERLRWGKQGLMVKIDGKRVEGSPEGKLEPLPSPPPRRSFPIRPLPFPSAEPEEEDPEDLPVPDTSAPLVAPAPKPK